MQLMLVGSWPGNFRRAIRDNAGEVVRIIEFSPGEVYDLTDEELEAVRNEVGVCLFPVEIDKRRGRHRPVSDPDLLRELNPTYLSPEPVAAVPVASPEVAMDVDDGGEIDESVFDGDEPAKRKKRK